MRPDYCRKVKRGVLTQGLEKRGLLGAGMPRSGPWCRETEGKFHVLSLLVKGGGVAGGERAAAPLLHVQNAHADEASDQTHTDNLLL